MIKHEIKLEFHNSESIKQIIQKSYFDGGTMGKIKDKTNYLTVDESDANYLLLKGLDGATTKITNDEVVDGSMRFMIDETNGDIRLYPISIYCIKENDKYIFY